MHLHNEPSFPRAEVSRTRYERKQALVAQWAAQLDEETDSEGQSESTMELDYQLPEASNADTVEDNLPSDDTAMARCGNVITDLPAELLSGIILLAHGKDARAPLVFSQINTSCREFSINTPILWSVIDILHPRNLTTLYLARSLGVPLEVRMIPIPSMVEPGGDATERLNQFISSLFPHQDRIRSLRMSFDRLPFATTAMSFLTNNNLRSLEILDFGGFGHLEDTTIIPDGGGLVSGWALRVLTIHGVRIDPESRFFPPTLTSLRLCGTSGFTITQLSQILLRTPALRFLCFDSFRLDDRDGFPCETIAALNHLTELRFDLVGDKYMDKIITHINTPQLHTLAVRPRFDLNITTSPSRWSRLQIPSSKNSLSFKPIWKIRTGKPFYKTCPSSDDSASRHATYSTPSSLHSTTTLHTSAPSSSTSSSKTTRRCIRT